MRVMGIDPGIERTGFAILEMRGNKPHVLDYGRIMTSKDLPFSARLTALAADLTALVREWKPAVAGVEEIYFSKNVKTAMKVSHARGVILETLEEHGVPLREFNPGEIKMAVTGNGRADKHEVKKMLHYLLALNLKNDDTADAIACGLCLLTSSPALRA